MGKFDCKWRFLFSTIFLAALFFINLFGHYKEGFARTFWFAESAHFIGGFLVAMWLSCFFRSTKFILIGLTVVTLMWEALEYAIEVFPVLTIVVQQTLKITDVSNSWGDTLLDVILNFTGAWLFIWIKSRQGKC